jgi:biopolymer transport protein ExbB
MLLLVDYGETFIFLALGFASVLAFATGIERTLVFKRHTGKEAEQFMRGLVSRLRAHDVAGALEFARSGGKNIYARFAAFSIEHYEQSHDGIADLMQGKIIEEKIQLEKRLPILNTLGNNAPFIGLLGTVLGVIKAFHGLGTLGATGAEVVMRSISSALLATAAGLFVAIPVVMANNYFSRKVKIILQNMEILSREFLASYTHNKKKSSH